LNTELEPSQHDLASKIGQHVRRTKSLVASLISFAKPGPTTIAPVDLNAVLRTAVKLSQPQWKTLNIEVSTVLQPDLPRVLGDSNQLLQVCVQLLNGAINAVERQGCGLLTITAEHKDGMAVIHIFDAGTAVSTDSTQPPAVEDAVLKHASARPLSGLGLSACQGILQQHHGKIFWQSDQNCGTSIRVNFPSLLRRPRDPPQQVAPKSGNLNRSLELAAGGVNVPTPRPPYKRWNSRIPQNLLKRRHALLPRSLEVNSRPRIQRNQIHFAPQPAQ